METTNPMDMDHARPFKDNLHGSTTEIRTVIQRLHALGNSPVPETLLPRVLSDLGLPAERERLTDPDQDLFQAYCNKGDYFCLLESYEEALTAYEHAFRLNPENATVVYRKGRILCELKRYEEALAAYEHTLHLEATLVAAYTEKGHVLRTLQRYEEALVAYEAALHLTPDDPVALRDKGKSLCDIARYKEALVVYEKALYLDPENASTWRDKCMALVALGDFAGALAAYQQVRHLDPATSLGQDVVEVFKNYQDANADRGRDIGSHEQNKERQAQSMRSSGQIAPGFTEIQSIQSNPTPVVHWPAESSHKQAVFGLTVEGTRIRQDTPLQRQIAAELEELLCQLFQQSSDLLVQPLVSGRSGARMLYVEPFYSTKGAAYPVVVKFGDARQIEQEHHNYKEYVEPFLGDGRNTSIRTMSRTNHLGGIIYSLPTTARGQLPDFGTFYQHTSVPQIKEVLDQLFLEICGRWYANRSPLQPLDLATIYQRQFNYSAEQLEQVRRRSLPSIEGTKTLSFPALQQQHRFLNPILAAADQKFTRSTYTCITHGDFNPHNLLVDSTGHVWMIDFEDTGQSHILRDIALLDAAIRFQLLTEMEATLEERFQMEEILGHVEHPNQTEHLKIKSFTANQAVEKTYKTIVHLRKLARECVKQNPSGDISEYDIALFYSALNTIQFTTLSPVQREHALLSASLLADQLGLGP